MYSILAGLTSLMLGPAIPGAPPEATEEPLFSLEKELPPFLIQNNTSAMLAKYDGIPLMDVTFDKVDWPNVFFKAPEKVWDWSEMLGIAVDIYNPESVPINVAMRIDNEGGNGLDNCITLNTVALPGKWVTFFAPMGSGGIDRFWGMRSVANRSNRLGRPARSRQSECRM